MLAQTRCFERCKAPKYFLSCLGFLIPGLVQVRQSIACFEVTNSDNCRGSRRWKGSKQHTQRACFFELDNNVSPAALSIYFDNLMVRMGFIVADPAISPFVSILVKESLKHHAQESVCIYTPGTNSRNMPSILRDTWEGVVPLSPGQQFHLCLLVDQGKLEGSYPGSCLYIHSRTRFKEYAVDSERSLGGNGGINRSRACSAMNMFIQTQYITKNANITLKKCKIFLFYSQIPQSEHFQIRSHRKDELVGPMAFRVRSEPPASGVSGCDRWMGQSYKSLVGTITYTVLTEFLVITEGYRVPRENQPPHASANDPFYVSSGGSHPTSPMGSQQPGF